MSMKKHRMEKQEYTMHFERRDSKRARQQERRNARKDKYENLFILEMLEQEEGEE